MPTPIRLHTDVLIERILWRHFQVRRHDLARSELQNMLGQCFSRCIIYPDGSLRQALIVSYLEFNRFNETSRSRQVAIIYLHLQNGLVYGLSATGDIARAIINLATVGAWLEKQSYDRDSVNYLENKLIELLSGGCAPGSKCTVELFHHAPVVPDEVILETIIYEKCRDVFNDIKDRFGFSGESFTSSEVLPYFCAQYARLALPFAQFRNNLDPFLLALVHEVTGSYTHHTEQLRVYNFLAGATAVVRRNRIQAIHELPWLVPLLTGLDVQAWHIDDLGLARTSPLREKLLAPVKNIIDAIDTGKPLFDAVASSFKIPRETVRWSRQKALPDIGHFDCYQVDFLLIALSWLPREKRPSTAAQWIQFGELVCACIDVLSAFNYRYTSDGLSHSPPRRSLSMARDARLSGILARWLGQLLHTDFKSASRQLRQTFDGQGSVADISDFLFSLYFGLQRFCIDPSRGTGHMDPDAEFIQAWLATKTIRQLQRMSASWCGAIQFSASDTASPRSTMAVDEGTDQPDSWPALLDQPFVHFDHEVVELTTNSSLIDEGEAMRHCIGGASSRCIMESSMVFSVRSIDGQRRSTVELRMDETSLKVVVAGHFANRNRPPDFESFFTVNALARALNSEAYSEKMQARLSYWHAQRNKYKGLDVKTIKSMDREDYDRRVSELAWRCAFGNEPRMRSGRPALSTC